jgi:hypothetical protein
VCGYADVEGDGRVGTNGWDERRRRTSVPSLTNCDGISLTSLRRSDMVMLLGRVWC